MGAMNTNRMLNDARQGDLQKAQPEVIVHGEMKLFIKKARSIHHGSIPEDCWLHNVVLLPEEKVLKRYLRRRLPQTYLIAFRINDDALTNGPCWIRNTAEDIENDLRRAGRQAIV